MIKPIRIDDKMIGPGYPCFIIAEAGVNHNGDIEIAKKLVDAAVEARADAVKFQSFVAEELVTSGAPKAEYQIQSIGGDNGQYSMLKGLELRDDNHEELKEYCTEAGILYLCTPYDKISVEMLDGMDVAAFKIAATDTTNIPFLRYVGSKGRPVILSTGMSTLGEIEQAVEALNAGGLVGKIILLHCTSSYPAPIDEANLRAILTMEQAFCCPVGYSDHTVGIGVSPWSVAVGACVIEKHFTLSREMSGPDHRASLEPDELFELVRTVRLVEAALGDGVKRPMASELKNKPLMQKSLVARQKIEAGTIICAEKLTFKRPGVGLCPSWIDRVVGKCAAVDIMEDDILRMSSIVWREE